MQSVYSDADFLAAYKQKQRTWYVFMGATFAYLVFCVAWLIYYINLPYNDPMQWLPKTMVFVASAVYVILIFPFMAIKYSRCNRYYKALSGFSLGLKSEEKNYFYTFDEQSLQKDNVDVVSCMFETWNKKKKEWMPREVYWDVEKELPDFGSGDYIQYVAQSNFILQYRILERGVLEFEEAEDEEEFESETEMTEEIGETENEQE